MRNLKNRDIRKLIEESRLYYWEVAEELGLYDANFSRKLRRELSIEEKQKILEAIKKLKERGN